uniref:Kinesin light chain n=2 Tax=Tetraselmis chuii TaxID=63592 RepID=A0A7S1X580_9CHLO|mmetsp:Transcript_32235/g.57687  ORF Transcript_32235/g.57687 Transcript_32235/m.57687 type:complete len:108 (+) Transcript_32235:411-734(+)
MAIVLTNLGGVLLSRGDGAEAAANMRKALDIKKRVYGERHPNVGDASANLAIVYASLGMKQEVTELLSAAEAAWESAFGYEESQSRLGLAQARVKSHTADAASPSAA